MAEKEQPKLTAAQEQKLIQKYYQRFRKSQSTTTEKRKLWQILDMFDRGDQWKNQAIPPWVPKPVTNRIRYVRTLKRANLASSIPKANFSPEYREDAAYISRLQKAYDHVWEKKKVPRVVRRSIDRALLQGTAIAYVYSEDDVYGKYYGENDLRNRLFQGDICVKRIPVANFFPDPDAYRLEECKFVEVTDVLSLAQVKENPEFQKYAGKKLQDLDITGPGQDQDESGAIYGREATPLNNGMNVQGDEMVTLHTHWDREFKDGKWTYNCTYYLKEADFILLRLTDIKPAEFPFGVLYDEEEEAEFFGSSTAMDILENQKIINKLDQTASILGVLHQNPQKVVLRESGINAQELARTGTLPGKVWTSNVDASKAISVVQPMDIPKSLFELKDRKEADIKDAVGVNEAYTGQSVGSLTTSTGVDSLIERATIRDKDKMIQIDEFVERISHLIVTFILYKWQDKRPITTTGPNGQPQYGEYEPISGNIAEQLEWRVKSDVYAKAPVTQATKRQQADNLMQMQGQFQFNPPIITPEEWIRFQDFDVKEEILARMQVDRTKLEAQKAQNLADHMMQIADEISKMRSQGINEQDIQQAAIQLANEFLQQEEQEEAKNGGQPTAEGDPVAPKGVTGQVQMNAMAKGM
jgi:hypothetical protein